MLFIGLTQPFSHYLLVHIVIIISEHFNNKLSSVNELEKFKNNTIPNYSLSIVSNPFHKL